jgi:hypothetical protein
MGTQVWGRVHIQNIACLFLFIYLFIVVLGFEFRVACLLGRRPTTWDTPPALKLWCFKDCAMPDLGMVAGWGRRMVSSRPAWATELNPVSNKTKQKFIPRSKCSANNVSYHGSFPKGVEAWNLVGTEKIRMETVQSDCQVWVNSLLLPLFIWSYTGC